MIRAKNQTIYIFVYAQVFIITMFTALSFFGWMRLQQTGATLYAIGDYSIPKITAASSLNNHIQTLAVLTTQLANTKNNPARRIAKQRIQQLLSIISNSRLNLELENPFFLQQLAILTEEIEMLDAMVIESIENRALLFKRLQNLNSATALLFANVSNISHPNRVSLQNTLLEIDAISSDILQQDKLSELRNIEMSLARSVLQFSEQLFEQDRLLALQMKVTDDILIGENGLIGLKIENLKLQGRAKGRENFIRNYIADIASNLQYQTQLIDKSTTKEAVQAGKATKRYSRIISIVSVLSVLLAIAIIYFLYKRIVSRLLSLSDQVEATEKTNKLTINISGSDEIARLAQIFSTYVQKVKAQEASLLALSLTDALTGIPNRRALEDNLAKAIALSQRNKWVLSVLILDVDFFKKYNDSYGHTKGDECLMIVANTINTQMQRASDFCARFGGEEFVCVFINSEERRVYEKAQAICQAVEGLKIPHVGSNISDFVTISIGVYNAYFDDVHSLTFTEIMTNADVALYQAKNAGRNCVKVLE